jgi:hypothetical protein
LHHPGPNGIEDYVAAKFKQIGLLIQQNRFEAALEEVSHPVMATIKGLGVNAV